MESETQRYTGFTDRRIKLRRSLGTPDKNRETLVPDRRHSDPAQLTTVGHKEGDDVDQGPLRSVLVLGEEGVGRRSLLNAMRVKEQNLKYCFVDSINSEEDHDDVHLPNYVIVFSVADRYSYNRALGMVRNTVNKRDHRSIFLLGNKSDLQRTREVTFKEASKAAATIGCHFIETSSLFDYNVDMVLQEIQALEDTGAHAQDNSSTSRKGRGMSKWTTRAMNGIQRAAHFLT